MSQRAMRCNRHKTSEKNRANAAQEETNITSSDQTCSIKCIVSSLAYQVTGGLQYLVDGVANDAKSLPYFAPDDALIQVAHRPQVVQQQTLNPENVVLMPHNQLACMQGRTRLTDVFSGSCCVDLCQACEAKPCHALTDCRD